MASDEAWSAGWNMGAGYAGERFAQKQRQADELRKGRLGEFNTAIEGLQKKYASALKTDKQGNTIETPASLQAKYALTQTLLARNTFLNPSKGPGIGEKIGEALHIKKKPQAQTVTTQTGGITIPVEPFRDLPAEEDPRFAVPAGEPPNPALKQRTGAAPSAAQPPKQEAQAGAETAVTIPGRSITVKGPAYTTKQMRDIAQRNQQAQEETELLTSAAPNAPLSPEQQAVQTAHAQSAGVWATLQDTLDAVAKFFPPEDREKPREAVLGKAFGTAEKKPVLKPLPGSKPYKKPDGVYYQSMLNSLTGEITAEPMPEGYMPPEGKPLSPGPQYFAAKKKEAMGVPLTPEEQAVLETYKDYVYETSTAPRVAGYVAGARARAEYQPTKVVNPDNPQEVITVTAGEARRGKYAAPNSIFYMTDAAGHKSLLPRNLGSNLSSLRTAEEHLRMASNLVDTLNTGSFTPFNPVVLAWARLNGQPAPANFEVVRTSLAGEMATAFTGVGATQQEIASIRKMINESDGPQALKSALNYSRKTLEVRRRNLWAQARMAGLNVPGRTTAPPRGGGGGVSVTAPDGSIHTFKNKAAADQFKKAAGIR